MNVKLIRQEMNLSQKEFAERFHISIRTLQGWEQERNNPPEYFLSMLNEIKILSNKTDNFYLFRSSLQHEIKRNPLQFILNMLSKNDIDIYFYNKMYLECFYLLACMDTLCEEYDLPLCTEYDKYRNLKVEEPIYLNHNNKESQNYLPHFKRYNIYEVTIYDAN